MTIFVIFVELFIGMDGRLCVLVGDDSERRMILWLCIFVLASNKPMPFVPLLILGPGAVLAAVPPTPSALPSASPWREGGAGVGGRSST